MHIILQKNVDELILDHELEEYSDSKKFEFFCNFCSISKKYLGRFNPKDITTDADDAAIDGIAIIIDGELIVTADDAEQIFSTHKSNLVVEVVFVQAKSGESFKKDEIANFSMGLTDFLSLEPELPNGKLNTDSLNIFKVVLNNLKKVRNRRPHASVYYCTSGTYKAEDEIDAAFKIVKRSVEETDLFYGVDVHPLGRSELLSYWTDISEKNEAKLKVVDYFGMPPMPEIPQSYIAVVNAKEFVTQLLTGEDGLLNNSVFEENVRAFLGSDNDVNSGIEETLRNLNKKKLFSVLNNGITIVAPELTLTPNSKEIDLTNYQIINGCQTSNALFLCQEELDDTVNVIVKFIESPNSDVSSDIIAATNSQSQVSKEAFYGLHKKAKLVQKYFEAKNKDALQDSRIYFERRENEYRDHGHQSTRVFDIRESSRAFAAMFLNQPHNAARYVKTIFSSPDIKLFREDDHESLYYCSALTMYKYNTLINGRKIGAPAYNKLRWHIIYLFKWVARGKVEDIYPNSGKASKYTDAIIKCLLSDDRSYVRHFERCQEIIEAVGHPTDDALKRGKFTADLRAKAEEILR